MYTYDDASRVTTVIVEDDSSVQVSKLSWDYDNAGRPEWEK